MAKSDWLMWQLSYLGVGLVNIVHPHSMCAMYIVISQWQSRVEIEHYSVVYFERDSLFSQRFIWSRAHLPSLTRYVQC